MRLGSVLVILALLVAAPGVSRAKEDVEALLALARDQESSHNWSMALSTYEKLLEDHPDNAVALFRRGVVRDSIGAHDMAIASYQQALKVDPNMTEAREALEGHYVTQGYAARAAGKREDAGALFRKAVDVNPEGRTGRLELGQELEARDDLAGAAAEYAAVTRNHPDDPAAHVRLGAVAARQGDNARAAREYAEVVRLTPLDPAGHRGLAVANEALGRKDEALAAAHEAMRSYMRKGLEDKALEMQGLERKLLAAGAQYRPTPRTSPRKVERDDD